MRIVLNNTEHDIKAKPFHFFNRHKKIDFQKDERKI